MRKYNTIGKIFGIDLTIDYAYQNLKGTDINLCEGSILHLPFPKNQFDFILSEGVLHHTHNTKEAFKNLVEYLCENGHLGVYIYRKKGPIREFCDEYFRNAFMKMDTKERWENANAFTEFGRALAKNDLIITVPKNLTLLQIKAGKYRLHDFIYRNIFKCFWNKKFTCIENNIVNFDWYSPIYAHRHTLDEVLGWAYQFNLEVERTHESDSGITMLAKKIS